MEMQTRGSIAWMSSIILTLRRYVIVSANISATPMRSALPQVSTSQPLPQPLCAIYNLAFWFWNHHSSTAEHCDGGGGGGFAFLQF